MAEQNKKIEQKAENLGADLSLDDLLSRLRDEHGADVGRSDSSNKKKKDDGDPANDLDDFEFDDRPIEADYLNYNMIGRGTSEMKDDVAPSEGVSDEMTDVSVQAEEEDLPWDDEIEDAPVPVQEDALYQNVREQYLRQRGLWQEGESESENQPEDDVLVDDGISDDAVEETLIYNKEENEASDDSLDAWDGAEDLLDESEFEESEVLEESEEIEDLDELKGLDELEDLDEFADLIDLEEQDELETVDVEETDAYVEPEENGEDSELEGFAALAGLEEPDETDVSSENLLHDEAELLDGEEGFSGSEENALSDFDDILTDVNKMLDDDSFSEYDLSDALGMTSRTAYVKPKERHKPASTPIDDEVLEKTARENAVLPSRKGHKEYTGYAQNGYIKKGYQSKLRAEGIRCIALALLTVIAFVVESLHLFGVTALHPSVNPMLAVAVSALVMLIACALTIWEYLDGAILLFHGTPVPESLLLPATIIPLIYYTVVLVSGSALITLFGFAFCVCALVCKLQTVFRILREARTFAVVSKEKPKRTLSALNRENALPEADVFSAYLSSEAKFHCVKRTLFVDDYFKATNKVAKSKKKIWFFLIASAVIALLVFVFAYVRLEQFLPSFAYAVISFFYTLPFSCLILFEIPLLWASFSAAEGNAAIVGEAAIESFAEEGAVSFADTDLFPPSNISLANILLFREKEMEQMMKYTALVFDEIHSSVSTVIMRSIPKYKLNDEIRISNIYDDGIEAYINQEQVLVGSYEFIKRFGASIPARYVHKKNGYAQMFTVVSGEVLGKFDIDYVLDPEIPEALTHIAESGFYVAVRTLDPNLTPEFLSGKLDYKNNPVKLIKVNDDRELLRMRKKVSAPIVTTEKTKSLMKALVLCHKSSFAQTMGLIFAAAGVLTGVGFVLGSIILENTAFVSGRAIVLFQLFWLLPVFFVSMLYVKNKSNKKKKK